MLRATQCDPVIENNKKKNTFIVSTKIEVSCFEVNINLKANGYLLPERKRSKNVPGSNTPVAFSVWGLHVLPMHSPKTCMCQL